MDKSHMLRRIAEAGYNIGFSAKMHLATYDIVEKAPGWIGLSSTSVGILSLFIDCLSAKLISAIFIIFGIAGLYISFYNDTKSEYAKRGAELTKILNEVKSLYFRVKSSRADEFDQEEIILSEIESRFCDACINKQIFMSGWYAHYKFFWQSQIEWMDEQKKFRFWRDKIPLSFAISLVFFVVVIGGWIAIDAHYFCK